MDDQLRVDRAEEEETILAKMNATTDSIFLIDLEGTVLAANETAVKQLGLPAGDSVGRNLFQLLSENLAGPWRELADRAIRSGQPILVEEEQEGLTIKKSTYPLCDVHGTITRLLLISRDITKRIRAEHQSRKRMKELQVFYSLSELAEREGITLDELCRELTNLLPQSWQYPEIAYARVVVDDREFRTENFTQSPWRQSAPIKVNGFVVGGIDVGYLQEQPEQDEGPFLKEERLLINAIAERLGRITERKRMEEKLQEAISYNRSLIDASVDPLVMIGPEGKITDVNQATETITGRTRQELVGTDFSDYFTDPEKARAGYHQVFAQGIVRDYELLLRHADGHATPVRYNATVYRDSLGQVVGVFAAARDVTEWKNAEETLVKNKQLLDETGRLARVGGWEIDLNKNELRWSDTVYQIHELDPAFHPTVETALNFYAPEAIPVISEAVRCAIEDGEPYDVELPLITAKGNKRWIRAIGQAYRSNGEIVKIGGVSQDITDRKLAENELKRHRDHLEELVAERTAELTRSRELLLEAEAVARLGNWEWDVVRDEITGSAEFYRLFDIEPEQLAHLPQFMGLLHADDRERVQQDLTDALEQCKVYDTDYRVILSDGQWRYINARGRVFADEKGKLMRMVGTCMDITERKRAEEAILRENQFSDAVIDCIPGIFYLLDEKGQFVRLNKNLSKVTGYSSEELLRFKATDIIAEEDRELVAGKIGAVFKKGYENVEAHLLTKDMQKFPYYFTGIPAVIADKTYLVGTGIDITERRLAEDALRESEVKYRELFENAQVGMYRSKLDGSALLAVNAKLCEIFGYSEEEMLGSPATIRWEDPRARDRMVTELLQAGFLHDYAMNIVRKSGEIRNCSVSISLYAEKGYIEGSAIDVTERKQAAEAAQESAVRYLTLFNNSTDGILIADIGTAAFKYANPALCRMFGYTEDELRTMGLPDIHPKEAMQSVVAEFEALARGDKTLAPGIPCLRKDGSVFHADIGAVKITVDGMPCNLGFFRDVTERKRVEEELAKKAQELARSNAELEQFAYVASHDLQEPLRMISSYVQLLARHNQGKLDSDSQEFIAFATDGATRMQALIQDLLAFSRVETRGKPFVPTDCEAVLERALSHLKVAIEESGARITSDPLPMLRADDNQLVQLFQNLVGNALKFHRPGVPPVIHIGAEQSGPDWIFAVRDNGIGIPAEQTQRVFEIFQRLHSRGEYPGTGIGLAVCRKIVERHGGRIWVESAVGEGSTFTFTLPQ